MIKKNNKNKVRKRGWQVIHWLIKVIPKFEISQRWREVIHRLIELLIDEKLRWKMSQWIH